METQIQELIASQAELKDTVNELREATTVMFRELNASMVTLAASVNSLNEIASTPKTTSAKKAVASGGAPKAQTPLQFMREYFGNNEELCTTLVDEINEYGIDAELKEKISIKINTKGNRQKIVSAINGYMKKNPDVKLPSVDDAMEELKKVSGASQDTAASDKKKAKPTKVTKPAKLTKSTTVKVNKAKPKPKPKQNDSEAELSGEDDDVEASDVFEE